MNKTINQRLGEQKGDISIVKIENENESENNCSHFNVGLHINYFEYFHRKKTEMEICKHFLYV